MFENVYVEGIVAEHKSDLPGVSWVSKPIRNYMHTTSLSHVVGYVGDITQEEITVLYNQGYTKNSIIGKTGIEILEISFIGFKEGAWREVTEERGKLSVETGKARAEFERKATIRSLETADAVDEIESKGAVANAAQEVTHRLDDKELDHTLGKDSRIFEHEQGKRKQEFEEDLYEISQLKKLQLEGKKQRLEIERENERLTLENRSNASVEALISILGGDDPAAKQIAKLELEKRAASLTTEQILAIQSVESSAAAEALKAKYSAEEQKEFNKRTEEMYRENTENMKEVMNTTMKDVMTTALNAMGSTATARATAEINTPPHRTPGQLWLQEDLEHLLW